MLRGGTLNIGTQKCTTWSLYKNTELLHIGTERDNLYHTEENWEATIIYITHISTIPNLHVCKWEGIVNLGSVNLRLM